MNSSSVLLPPLLLLPTILIISILLSPLAGAQNSNHFAEYIGAEFTGVKFSDVPINSGVDFHFILSFAIDYTTTTSPPSPTNGDFNVFWDSGNLSPADVSAIKQANPNVKVAVSIGGATVSGNTVYFSPSSADSWVSNAVSSLTSIIQQYNLDGIDIDYESFQASSATFINKIFPTPFDNSDVQGHYQALWASYSNVIDFVNFQFYAYSSATTVSQFLSYYDTQRSNYAGGQVLVSFSTDGSGGLSPANGFFDACQTLKGEGKLAGIFAWTADSSKSNGFQYETQAQNLLAS
ncbi:hypothetical protein IEQ34_021495 [Dendrobium chrysotoxum]|uniref:GH18 domain-containing protein n=1 Tax=Dendrobium chrysotoxum TaxID=161865 RepID=A0AAV7G548_DENCH|nr:hypothetical protein IEQ34_021495 [Dendrobium chrysotoxum]